MGFVICGALCHAEGGNEQGMAYQTGPGVSEAVMETINSGTTTNVRSWLEAAIHPHSDLRPLYPRKQT